MNAEAEAQQLAAAELGMATADLERATARVELADACMGVANIQAERDLLTAARDALAAVTIDRAPGKALISLSGLFLIFAASPGADGAAELRQLAAAADHRSTRH